MEYKTVKIGQRIVYVPDEDLRQRLIRLKQRIKDSYYFALGISTFRHNKELPELLLSHKGHRFFVVIDFVHAFRQITRKMLSRVWPDILHSGYDDCFISEQEFIPAGFPTSSHLFELYLKSTLDKKLAAWAARNNGAVTRHCDNILCTWQKNPPAVFEELQKVFAGFNVRYTPSKPRKWNGYIRFCGLIILKNDRVALSRRRKRELLSRAKSAQPASAKGLRRYVSEFDN